MTSGEGVISSELFKVAEKRGEPFFTDKLNLILLSGLLTLTSRTAGTDAVRRSNKIDLG